MRLFFSVFLFLLFINTLKANEDTSYTKEALFLKNNFSRAIDVKSREKSDEMQLFLENLLKKYPRESGTCKWIDDLSIPLVKNNEYKTSRFPDSVLFKLPDNIQQELIDKYFHEIDETTSSHYASFKERYPKLGRLLDKKGVDTPNYRDWSNGYIKNTSIASLRLYSYKKEYMNSEEWLNDFISDLVFVDLWQTLKYDYFYRESKDLLKQSLSRFFINQSSIDTTLHPLKDLNSPKYSYKHFKNRNIISDAEIQWEIMKTFYWPREALSYINTRKGTIAPLAISRRNYAENILNIPRFQDSTWVKIIKWTLHNNITDDQKSSVYFFELSLAYLHKKDYLGAFLMRHSTIQLHGWNSSNYNEICKMFIGFAGKDKGNRLFNEYRAICPIKTYKYKDRKEVYKYRVNYFKEEKNYEKVVENLKNLDPRSKNPTIQQEIKNYLNIIPKYTPKGD